MIIGIGCDLCKVFRFEKYFSEQEFIKRFFNDEEIKTFVDKNQFCRYYASRFACKEAFVKAIGTGFKNINLKDLFVKNDEEGKPYMVLQGALKKRMADLYNASKIHLSISHEDDYAIAFVIIEN